MGYFNRDDRPSGRRSFGRRDFGGRGGNRQMHKTICSKCGRECEVPFKPSGDKPVFCSDCFAKNKGGSESGRFSDRGPRRPQFDDRNRSHSVNNDQFNTIDAKLDKILAMLSAASTLKPVRSPKIPIIEEPKIPENVLTSSKEPIIPAEKKKKSPKTAPQSTGV